MLRVQCFVFALMCCAIEAAIADPCTTYKQLSRAEYRGGKCMRVANKEVCDRTLAADWYRATDSTADLQMQETIAPFESCGTELPYWMNGTHPTVADGEVNRTVCQTSFLSNCSRTKTIQVKNCGSFYVYKLQELSTCPSAYCFGANNTCPPFDPCDYYENIRFPYDAGRASICNAHGTNDCDTTSFDVTKWYSFKDAIDYSHLNVTTQCPSQHACGTLHPLWIKGYINGSDDAIVCEMSQSTCCHRQFTIASKECKGFRVYKFTAPPVGTCNRYCVDDPTARCPIAPTTTATSTIVKLPGYTRPGVSTTSGGNGDGNVDRSGNNSGTKELKDYIWVIGLVAGVAICTIITVAVLVVKLVLPTRPRMDKMIPINAVTPAENQVKKLPIISQY